MSDLALESSRGHGRPGALCAPLDTKLSGVLRVSVHSSWELEAADDDGVLENYFPRMGLCSDDVGITKAGHATYLETQRYMQSLHTLHIRYFWTPKARSARPILEEFYTPGCSRGRRGCDAASHPS